MNPSNITFNQNESDRFIQSEENHDSWSSQEFDDHQHNRPPFLHENTATGHQHHQLNESSGGGGPQFWPYQSSQWQQSQSHKGFNNNHDDIGSPQGGLQPPQSFMQSPARDSFNCHHHRQPPDSSNLWHSAVDSRMHDSRFYDNNDDSDRSDDRSSSSCTSSCSFKTVSVIIRNPNSKEYSAASSQPPSARLNERKTTSDGGMSFYQHKKFSKLFRK